MTEASHTEPTLERVLDEALEVAQSSPGIEGWSGIWEVLKPARVSGRVAMEAALSLLGGASPERQVGCELVATLCNPDNHGWSHEAAVAVCAIADGQLGDELSWSVANALYRTEDPIGLATLVGLSRHHHPAVRRIVATGLPWLHCDEQGCVKVVEALIELSGDDDESVRDWATFGLGTVVDVDSAAVREALVRRLDDHHDDTRCEALVGLARRRDARAFLVTRAALRADPVFLLAVEAAAYLADPRLLPELVALEECWDVDASLLRSAIDHCDPRARDSELTQMVEFASALHQALDAAGSSATASLSCERFGLPGVLVEVSRAGIDPDGVDRWSWDYDAMLARGGGLAGAVASVIADLER